MTCLGEALNTRREELPLYRGQNEQSMGFAAAGYAKQWLRQRFMFCTASAGPGTLNLVTAAALAHANRLPMLLLCGDTFLTRLPIQSCSRWKTSMIRPGANDPLNRSLGIGIASHILLR